MQVNMNSSVATQSFGSKNAKTGRKITSEEFAKMGNKELEGMAYAVASYKVNDKKHNRISNIIHYSLPIAGGISLMAATKGFRIDKLAAFGKGAASWVGFLALADGIFALGKKAYKNNETFRKAYDNAPIATNIGLLGALYGTYKGATAGLAYAADKLAPKLANLDKNILKANGMKNFATRAYEGLVTSLQTSKVLNTASKLIAKVPSPIRSLGKGAMLLAPIILIGTQVLHSLNHSSKRNIAAMDAYKDLKDLQQEVRKEFEADKVAKDNADVSEEV